MICTLNPRQAKSGLKTNAMPHLNVDEKPFARVKSQLLREGFALWESKRGTRLMPRRADFDPVEMPRLLSSIILVDVEDGSARLRIRLVGTKVVEMFGSDYTGRYMDEIDFGDVREKILKEYRLPISEKRPVFSDHEFRKLNDHHHTIERAIFPLSDDGITVNKLIAFLDFERVRRI